jgi:signal transduction histidine kinase
VLNNYLLNAVAFSTEPSELILKVVYKSQGTAPATTNQHSHYSPSSSSSSTSTSSVSHLFGRLKRQFIPSDDHHEHEPCSFYDDFYDDDGGDDNHASRRNDACVEFSIQDYGIGISREDKKKLFKAFSKVLKKKKIEIQNLKNKAHLFSMHFMFFFSLSLSTLCSPFFSTLSFSTLSLIII